MGQMFTREQKEAVACNLIHNTWFYVLSLLAVGLVIASFIVPPTGVIDPSVLAATGEIFAFAALGTVLQAINLGLGAKVTHNDTSIEIHRDDPSTDE